MQPTKMSKKLKHMIQEFGIKNSHQDENNAKGRFNEQVKNSKLLDQQRKIERTIKVFKMFQMNDLMPAVGQYDVERSRNLIECNQPVYTVPKSKIVMFNDSKDRLPYIASYISEKGFSNIYRPYCKSSWQLPQFG